MVRAIIIVEIAGKPAEHVRDMLQKHMDRLKTSKGVEVHSLTVSEPRLVEGSKDTYTCFSEADLEADSFELMTHIIFEFMPSSIEILEPGSLELSSQEMTNLLNNIAGRLHNYDNIAKLAHMRMQDMARELLRLGSPMIKKVEPAPTPPVVIEEAKYAESSKVSEKKVSKKKKKKK